MGFSSTAGAVVEATAFASKPAEGAEAGILTSGGLFATRSRGGASAVGFGSSVACLTACSGVIILIQRNRVKSRVLQGVNESSQYWRKSADYASDTKQRTVLAISLQVNEVILRLQSACKTQDVDPKTKEQQRRGHASTQTTR
jgi:hypothetical protein